MYLNCRRIASFILLYNSASSFLLSNAVSLLLFYSLKFTAVQSAAAGDNAGQNKLRMQASCAITCTTAARGRTCFHLLCAVVQRTPLISLIIALLYYLIHLGAADFKIHEYLGKTY
jgi:hypothetical protein